MGFLKDRSDELCSKCEEGRFEYKQVRSDGYAYVCNKRGCKRQVSATADDPVLFLERVPLRKQLLVIYNMIYHKEVGVDSWAFDSEMDDRATSQLVQRVRNLVSWWMIRGKFHHSGRRAR